MRNLRLDVARGLLMLYIIVAVHGSYWLGVGIGAGEARSWMLFEMPCIFFVSGYAYALSLRTSGAVQGTRHYLAYIARRALRILAPYWLYAAACLCLLFLKGGASAAAVGAWLNPLQFGQGYTFFVLNAHLWFIAPYLGVAMLMPAVARVLGRKPPALEALMLLGALLILAADLTLQSELGRNVLTYAVWAVLGYAAGAGGAGLPRARCLQLFALCCVLLAAAWSRGWISLDMQANKFPPNSAFFLFGLAWFCVWSLAVRRAPESTLERLRAAAWFRPFVDHGYSLYLWQGLGYTLARYVGNRVDAPLALVWALAILFTVGLGMAAAPMESLRFSAQAKR
jgi:peptidoglycan/LPS O-acetylase OafA/YrhL